MTSQKDPPQNNSTKLKEANDFKLNFYFIGYLSEDDIKHVCTSYSTAYQMNISKTHIYEAMNNARSMDPGTDLINIGLFCRFLDDVLFKQ